MTDEGEALTVLICSCNMGNAEPTASSFGAWVPDDGDVKAMLLDTLYPVPSEIVPKNSPSKDAITVGNVPTEPGNFDVIVLGMQEATFDVDSKEMDSDEEAASRATEESKKKKKKKTKNPIKKAYKAVVCTTRTLVGSSDNTKEVYSVPELRRVINRDADRKSFSYFGDTHALHGLVKDRCPSYTTIVDYNRGQMRMMILVKTGLKDQVTDIDVDAENTGLVGVLANKGGIVSSITVRNTRLSFMTAHLEAHEGGKHYMNRNSNLAEILSGARVGPGHKYFDASLNSHHAFFCGDLNYRVVLPEKEIDQEEHKRIVRDMVEKEEWSALNDYDELGQALTKKECLNGFMTLPCHFPPTFKVTRQDGYAYNAKRTPSYTDRVLWKSADGFESNLSPICYEPCPDFITSDHKPFWCALKLEM
uniref:Inositol polyphosphate-related phosphatase domain-containing protein n=1 Tax=Ditylum brightwellii TaxID=49249 RepID=A0A7S2END7_9STRA|mmetsp:Transcript_36516/g.54527  ORF Transcript_36516/g.54527 Transcript_36516/m.54527 type:complete len:419 (+) Transcript_36516:115-1371(+)